MYYKEIQNLQKLILELQNSNCADDLNEANTRTKIVSPLLNLLGFKSEWQFFESHIIKGKAITDISVKRNSQIFLLVEVKKAATNKIDIKDLHQLTGYLNSKNIEWGMLTNGIDYLLVNNDIKGEYNEKTILRYNIFEEYDEKKVNYFSYKDIFENRNTLYIKHLKQYQIFKFRENSNNHHSWSRYNDTIQKYFLYLQNKIGYRELKYLNSDDFMSFVNADIINSQDNKDRRAITSLQTIKNKYAHIKNFYDLLVKNKILSETPFKSTIEDSELENLYGLRTEEYPDPLTVEEARHILNGYEESRQPERNKLMFLLCLYCGLSRENIMYLKISDIDFDKRTIRIKDNSYIIPQSFAIRIKNYIENIREKEFNSDYFFVRKYGNYSEKPLATGTPNDIIKKASSYLNTMHKPRNVQINPEKLKGMLIKKLFEVGFSLEEIIVITGVSLSSLPNYIATDSILERTQVKKLDERHPYIELYK